MNEHVLMSHIIQSDVPEAYQPVVSLIGLEGFLKLCQYAMGDDLYFPKIDTMIRHARNRLIREEYNGYNAKELSKKYGITFNQMKSLVKDANS